MAATTTRAVRLGQWEYFWSGLQNWPLCQCWVAVWVDILSKGHRHTNSRTDASVFPRSVSLIAPQRYMPWVHAMGACHGCNLGRREWKNNRSHGVDFPTTSDAAAHLAPVSTATAVPCSSRENPGRCLTHAPFSHMLLHFPHEEFLVWPRRRCQRTLVVRHAVIFRNLARFHVPKQQREVKHTSSAGKIKHSSMHVCDVMYVMWCDVMLAREEKRGERSDTRVTQQASNFRCSSASNFRVNRGAPKTIRGAA